MKRSTAWLLTIDYLLDAPHPNDRVLVERYLAGQATASDLEVIERLAECLFGDWEDDDSTDGAPLPKRKSYDVNHVSTKKD